MRPTRPLAHGGIWRLTAGVVDSTTLAPDRWGGGFHHPGACVFQRILWGSCRDRVGISWVSRGDRVGISWGSRGDLGIAWGSCGDLVGITWESGIAWGVAGWVVGGAPPHISSLFCTQSRAVPKIAWRHMALSAIPACTPRLMEDAHSQSYSKMSSRQRWPPTRSSKYSTCIQAPAFL